MDLACYKLCGQCFITLGGSRGGSSGSKSDTLDLSDLFGDSKSQSTFGEWSSTSDKQECRSECRPKSAGSY